MNARTCSSDPPTCTIPVANVCRQAGVCTRNPTRDWRRSIRLSTPPGRVRRTAASDQQLGIVDARPLAQFVPPNRLEERYCNGRPACLHPLRPRVPADAKARVTAAERIRLKIGQAIRADQADVDELGDA